MHMACTWHGHGHGHGHAHGVCVACAWQAIAKLEALQLLMSEIETWCASVKAEAAGERQMREQASE